MATFTKRISANLEGLSDKYNSHWSPTWIAESATYGESGQIGVFAEWEWWGEWNGGIRNTSWRFTNITIPQGATITSAKITFSRIVGGGSSHTINYKFVGVDEDNTGALTVSDTCRTRTHTTAAVDWDVTIPPGDIGSTYDSVDISSVIQEIINRGGWSSGNALGIYLYDDGTTEEEYFSYMYYSSYPDDAPLLTIEYVASSASASESRSPSISESRSISLSPSLSGSASPSPSSSESPSPSLSPSPSSSISLSPSVSESRSPSVSESASPSLSPSPSSTPSASPSPIAPFFGLKIAKPRINVLNTDTPHELIFSSDYGTLKYLSKHAINISFDAGDGDISASGSYSHNLNYYPYCEVFVSVNGGNYQYCPFAGAGATVMYAATYIITETGISVYGMINGVSGSVWTFDFLVFLYKNNLNL